MRRLAVTVAVATPERQEVCELSLPAASTVADALRAARVTERFPEIDLDRARVGIWSRPCAPAQRLRDGDRVEVYRPLLADPKQQRRARASVKPATRSRSGR